LKPLISPEHVQKEKLKTTWGHIELEEKNSKDEGLEAEGRSGREGEG
jgi:hypothetical protein